MKKARASRKAAGVAVEAAALAADVVAVVWPPAAVLKLAVRTTDFVLKRARERREREVSELIQEILVQPGDPSSIAVEIEARIRGSEEVQDAVLAQVRRVLAGVDPRVVPPLALLTRPVVQGGAKADSFFRGFSRVLADLSSDEYDLLRVLIRGGLAASSADPLLIMLYVTETGQEAITVHADIADLPNAGLTPEICRGHWQDAKLLMALLSANGIAALESGSTWSGTESPSGIRIGRSVAQRMAACMVR